jgi:ComF family protein
MILKSLAALFTLQTCYACEENLTIQEHFVCFNCLGQIPATHFHCKPTENELYYRLAGKVPLAGAMSLFYFDKAGKLQRLISQIKYKNALPLARYLGEYYGHVLQSEMQFPEDTVLLPVPLHWRKRYKRGYNQALVIAGGMGKALHLKVSPGVLKRKRFTTSQTRLSGAARWENVASAFRLHGEPPRHVLLVDDVITTGATLEACLRVLFAAERPPEQVWALSLGMARKN